MESDVVLDIKNHLWLNLTEICSNFSFDVVHKKLVRNSCLILLRSLIMIIFIVENDCSIVTVKTERINLHYYPCYIKNSFTCYLYSGCEVVQENNRVVRVWSLQIWGSFSHFSIRSAMLVIITWHSEGFDFSLSCIISW